MQQPDESLIQTVFPSEMVSCAIGLIIGYLGFEIPFLIGRAPGVLLAIATVPEVQSAQGAKAIAMAVHGICYVLAVHDFERAGAPKQGELVHLRDLPVTYCRTSRQPGQLTRLVVVIH